MTPTVYDLSDRTQLEITGADRQTFLHGFCTNDIKGLKPGQGCEAFLTNIKGRVVGHGFFFATASAVWFDCVAGQAAAVMAHLDRYLIREDVQFHDRTGDLAELYVSGAGASDLLMIDEGLGRCGHIERELDGQRLHFRRVDLLGEPGFLISLPLSARDIVQSRLTQVGCTSGTALDWETRRIESGVPYYGQDITDEQIAQEAARTKECISFTKGCYLGQEPIARLDALGHTNRELRRIVLDPGPDVEPGPIQADAQEAGMLTSVAPTNRADGATAALGYLKTRFAAPGTRIQVGGRSGTVQPVNS